ncbi:MAG TPA: Vms1/Ankzf1 family peptidyl-tRNA hydrolase [Thermomicrobiales bacterium]|nr:Vms1/Ankzf1 family peptidyl-tRNA hydrolase [Thermomicrobiales bacterium]
MATNPVRRVRRQSTELPIELNLQSSLEDLATYPASIDVPYLTVAIDWTPAGSDPGRIPTEAPKASQRRADTGPESVSARPGRTIIEAELKQVIEAHDARSAIRISLEKDREQLLAYLDSEIDPAVTGLYVVANADLDVFDAIPLGLAVANSVAIGPTPDLSTLAHLIDDNPTFAVLWASQSDATLTVFQQGSGSDSVEVQSNAYPRKQQTGGLNQKRYSNRAGERVSAFARVVAAEVQQEMDRAAVDHLILAGDEQFLSELIQHLHETIARKVIANVRTENVVSENDLLELSLPFVGQAERDEEQEDVQQLANRIGADDRAVAGIDGVLRAMQAGSVATLILIDSLEGTGWGDFEMELFGTGDLPTEHPAGGDVGNIVAIDLDEELIRLAVQTGASIQFVKSATASGSANAVPRSTGDAPVTDAAALLEQFSGVGALLRFDM